jgi:hypothetical protein
LDVADVAGDYFLTFGRGPPVEAAVLVGKQLSGRGELPMPNMSTGKQSDGQTKALRSMEATTAESPQEKRR